MKTTVRNLRKVIAEQIEFDMKPRIHAFHDNNSVFSLQLVPVDAQTGVVIESEITLIHDGKGDPKQIKSNKSVYAFAERYGITGDNVQFGMRAL